MISQPLPSRWPQVVVNLVTLAAVLVLNTLATTLPLGGRTTAEISDSFNLRFVPAGYVFAIWGLIYLALIGFAVFQALPRQQANPAVRATGYWFALGNVANAVWIVAWHYGYFTLTMAVMAILLASLIVIHRRLAALPAAGPGARWLVGLPFSLYLGWISVATIANASAWLVHLGWDGRPLDPVVWAALMAAVAGGLGAWLAYRYRDLVYAGVLVWALAGIVVAQAAYAPIAAASVAAVIAILGGAAAGRWGGGAPRLGAAPG
jgi:benzodiazapine receptor